MRPACGIPFALVVSLVSTVSASGAAGAAKNERLLCSFEKAEVTKWAFQVQEVSDAVCLVLPEKPLQGFRGWHIRKGDATDGQWAYADVVEGTRWSAVWEGRAGLRPQEHPYVDRAYHAMGAGKFNTFYPSTEGWFRRAFPADWSDYDLLRIDIKCDKADVKMWLGLEDDEIEPYIRRDFSFPAGRWFTLEVDLTRAADERGLDLRSMRNLWSFVWEVSAEATILMDNIRLASRGTEATYPLLRDDSPMKLPEPPGPVKPVSASIRPDHSLLPSQAPMAIDLSGERAVPNKYGNWVFYGFGNPNYRFLWRGGVSAFDNDHLAVLFQTNAGRGVMVTSDGGTTWTGLDGGVRPTLFATHNHAMGATATCGESLMVAARDERAACGGRGMPTDRVWFRKLAFQGDSWELGPESLVSSDPRHCPYTYSLARNASGRIWISWAESDRQGRRSLHLKYSDDDGRTWLSWRPGKTGCLDDSGLVADCGTVVPCGSTAMCLYARYRQRGFSATSTLYTVFDGRSWPKPSPINDTGGRVISAVCPEGEHVLVSKDAFGKGSVYHWDGASWGHESSDLLSSVPGGFLTAAGNRAFLVTPDQRRDATTLLLWERGASGVWTGPTEIVSEEGVIDTYAVPMTSPPNYVPVVWCPKGRQVVKVLRLPVPQ